MDEWVSLGIDAGYQEYFDEPEPYAHPYVF